jgi:hypothetical protein
VNGRCVLPTHTNSTKRSCTRIVTAGTLTFAGRDGANRVRFDGRLSSVKRLHPGGYTVLVTATVSGRRSLPKTLHFTIAG